MSHPDAGVNLSPDCGVVDQAGGYESLMATERQLEQAELARRAAEAAAAAEQADTPTL